MKTPSNIRRELENFFGLSAQYTYHEESRFGLVFMTPKGQDIFELCFFKDPRNNEWMYSGSSTRIAGLAKGIEKFLF